MIGCHCAVCTSDDPRDQRMRCAVLISYQGKQVLIDTTPELRMQCLRYQVESLNAVVITHAHADHIMGMDDLRRFNALRRGPLEVWADEPTHRTLQMCFGYAFAAPDPQAKVFRPHLIRRDIAGPFNLCGRDWTPIPLWHGGTGVLGFRVGNIAYCTDVSRIPDPSYQLLQNLDVLVLDGLQYQRHTTHFSVEEAVAEAQKIGAKRTYLTHIAHGVQHHSGSAALPEGIFLAYDGLRVAED